MAHQRAGINIRENGNVEALEVFVGDRLRAPVGTDGREFANYKAFDEGPGGFIVFGVGSVIADLRVGEDNDLSCVRGIGEDFLVTSDGSIENYFPVTFGLCSVAFAAEDPPIFQRK